MIVAEVLHSYWEALPAHIVNTMLQTMYNDLAFDGVVEVRQAVFKVTS